MATQSPQQRFGIVGCQKCGVPVDKSGPEHTPGGLSKALQRSAAAVVPLPFGNGFVIDGGIDRFAPSVVGVRRSVVRDWRIASAPYRIGMCRSIKTLRRPGETATTGELEAAARQYVRKLSGYREPSARNQEAFEAAVAEIAHASRHLVESIGVPVEEGPNRWTPGSGQARTRPRVLA